MLTTTDKKIKTLQQKPDCLKQEKKAPMQSTHRQVKVGIDS